MHVESGEHGLVLAIDIEGNQLATLFHNITTPSLLRSLLNCAQSNVVFLAPMNAWLAAMTQIPGVIVKDGWDIASDEVQQKIVEFLNGKKADVIMR